ncbi:MAG: PDZ domain-containing protein [Saprospiraceae bacterium]|nr:PDZ domain-containing protein [Saprospiraceae bacterium]
MTTGSDRSLNIFIQYVIPGSPGSESGLLPGDKLITINGWSVKLLGSLQTVNKFLRRDADKVLRIKVKRHDKTLIKKLTLRNYLE